MESLLISFLRCYRLTTCQYVKLLLAVASTVILGSECHGTRDHILFCDGSGSLRTTTRWLLLYNLGTDCIENTLFSSSFIVADMLVSRCPSTARLFIELSPCYGQCLSNHVTMYIHSFLKLKKEESLVKFGESILT
jgi:hypothetical protein